MVIGIHHEHGVKVFDLPSLAPHLLDRVTRRGSADHRDEVGGHQTSRRLLVVAQQALEVDGFLGRECVQDCLGFCGLQLADEIDRVVVGHLVDQLGPLLRLEGGEQRPAMLALFHLGEGVRGELRRQCSHQRDTELVTIDGLEQIGHIGRMHTRQRLGECGDVAGLDQSC